MTSPHTSVMYVYVERYIHLNDTQSVMYERPELLILFDKHNIAIVRLL